MNEEKKKEKEMSATSVMCLKDDSRIYKRIKL